MNATPKVFDLKAYSLRIKREAIRAYGGKCACCNVRDIGFLTIDHINGNGKEERKRYGSGKQFYAALKRQGFPQNGYRILCMNCNWVIRFGDRCPHQVRLDRIVFKQAAKRLIQAVQQGISKKNA